MEIVVGDRVCSVDTVGNVTPFPKEAPNMKGAAPDHCDGRMHLKLRALVCALGPLPRNVNCFE